MDAPLLPALPGYDNPQLIAHGTTALVFRATQTTLNRLVAIKVITVDTGSVPVSAERELATTVALSSQPHIVSIIDTGITGDDRPYIVMEYCEGGSYAQILRHGGPLPVADVIEVGIKIGEALHAAHQAGIVHRDVKPSNILRSRFGPALTDFGIARAPDELSGTLTREMMTPHHASPEALLHQAQSGLSDVYSLASTMWTLLLGHPPFVDPARPPADMYAFRDRVLHEPLPPMTRDEVPAWLASELGRAMSKLPADRHVTALDFAESLRRGSLGLSPASAPAAPQQRGTVHAGGLPAAAWPVATPPRYVPETPPDAPAHPAPHPEGRRASRGEDRSAGSPETCPTSAPGPATPTPPAPSPASAATSPTATSPTAASAPAAPAAPEPAPGSPHPAAPQVPASWPAAATSPPVASSPSGSLGPGASGALAGPTQASPRVQQDSAAQFGAGRAPVYVPAARDPAAGHLLDTPGGHLHDAPALPDEGGWLGPPTPGDVGHGDDVETARQRQGTRRFTETDLRPASARRNGLVVLLIAIAVLGVAAGAALVLTSGRSPAATTGPTQTPTVTLTVSTGVAGAPTAVKVTRDGTSVTVAWTDPTKGTVSFLVVGQGPTGDYLPTRDVAAGTTVVTFIQLDPAKRYCFQVAAVYSITRLAYTAPVCTA